MTSSKSGKPHTLHPTPYTPHPTPCPHEKLFQQPLNKSSRADSIDNSRALQRRQEIDPFGPIRV
ncbi:MAG: hypothetical protein ACKO2T_27430, partial [Microcystis aeruginosa]